MCDFTTWNEWFFAIQYVQWHSVHCEWTKLPIIAPYIYDASYHAHPYVLILPYLVMCASLYVGHISCTVLWTGLRGCQYHGCSCKKALSKTSPVRVSDSLGHREPKVCLLFQWSLESQSPHSPGIPQKRYTHTCIFTTRTNSNEVHAEHTIVLRFHSKYIHCKNLRPLYNLKCVLVTLVTTQE